MHAKGAGPSAARGAGAARAALAGGLAAGGAQGAAWLGGHALARPPRAEGGAWRRPPAPRAGAARRAEAGGGEAAAEGPGVVVLGGGAAGLLAAVTAGRRGRRVRVLERNPDIGRKIRISGGGRCNFTNISVDLQRSFHSSDDGHDKDGSGRFFQHALEQYPPSKFIAMVESHGIKFHEKKLGQLFCDRSAQQLVEMLREECRAAGVEIRTGTSVESVSSLAPSEPAAPGRPRFEVECERLDEEGGSCGQETLPAEAVLVASGGLSYARSCGSTDLAHRVAKDFGLQVQGLRPGLVPLLLPEDEAWVRSLAGLALEVRASMGSKSFVENLLFTHRGLSGPVILQISSFWRPDLGDGAGPSQLEPLVIDLAPREGEAQVLSWLQDLCRKQPGQPAVQALRTRFPSRFAAAFWEEKAARACGAARGARLQDLSPSALSRLAQLLKRWELPVVGSEGYPKAEVTCGGVATHELSDHTMEAHRCPGLYFIGESVDVTGWLGGYNLQWAWASGYAAGLVC